MTLNLAAYSTEIIRAGVDVDPQVAGRGRALAGAEPGARSSSMSCCSRPSPRVWPALSSQFVLMMLASSICLLHLGAGTVGHGRDHRAGHLPQLRDLHHRRPCIYLVLALSLKLCLHWLGRRIFPQVSGLARVPMRMGRPPDEDLRLARGPVHPALRRLDAAADRHRASSSAASSAASSRSCGCRGSRRLRRFAAGYILVIQSIPVLMVLFMSYYGLSPAGIELPPFFAASASLGDLRLGLSRRDLARLDRVRAAPAMGGLGLARADAPPSNTATSSCRRRCGSRCRRRSASSSSS